MKTLVDLFEVSTALTSPRPLPAPPAALVEAAYAYDGRSTLVDVEVDWEETFHGSNASPSSTFRGARVWSSED